MDNVPTKPGWYWLVLEGQFDAHKEVVHIKLKSSSRRLADGEVDRLVMYRAGDLMQYPVAFPDTRQGWSWGGEVDTPKPGKPVLYTLVTYGDAADSTPGVELHNEAGILDRKKEIIEEALTAADGYASEESDIDEIKEELAAGKIADAWESFIATDLDRFLDSKHEIESHDVDLVQLFGSSGPTPKALLDCYKPWQLPFVYEAMGQQIMDSAFNCVLDVRGWGRLTGHGSGGLKMTADESAKVQDAFGRRVVELLNQDTQT